MAHHLYDSVDGFQRVHLYLYMCAFFCRTLHTLFFKGIVTPKRLKKKKTAMRNREDDVKDKIKSKRPSCPFYSIHYVKKKNEKTGSYCRNPDEPRLEPEIR